MYLFKRFYRFLEVKSKHPDAAVPPIDDTLKKITEPDADLVLQNQSVIDAFCRSFELKENPLVRMSVCFALSLYLTSTMFYV